MRSGDLTLPSIRTGQQPNFEGEKSSPRKSSPIALCLAAGTEAQSIDTDHSDRYRRNGRFGNRTKSTQNVPYDLRCVARQ
jgi:hypothetical protein